MNYQPLTIDQLQQMVPSAFATSAHESRSARYTYIPTSEIIRGMMKEGFLPFAAKQSSTKIAGKEAFTKHLIRFRHASERLGLQVGDSVPEVVVVNAHDGTSAFNLIAALWRLICGNGMMVSDGPTGSVRVTHSGNILDNVIEGSYRVVKESALALETSRTWGQLVLTAPEQKVFAEAARTVRFGDSEGQVTTPITAEQLLRPRRSADQGADLWHTFNRVQENVVKGGVTGYAIENGRRRATTTREIKGIDQDVKLNRALWTLGEKMAEMKGLATVAPSRAAGLSGVSHVA
jgi:hypothetical protein